MIHGDIYGPVSPSTPASNKYFLLLVDDFSHMMWVYMIKTKYKALNAFKEFRATVETKSKKGIQVFRMDRGGSFVQRNFCHIVRMRGFIGITQLPTRRNKMVSWSVETGP